MGFHVWSECVAEAFPSYSPETVDTCWLAITEWLAPHVLGKTVTGASGLHAEMSQHVRGHSMAKAAIEMGAWAIEAEQSRISLAALLAERSLASGELSILPRTHVETGIALGMEATPDALASHATEVLSEGYRRLKIKIVPGKDVEFVRAVRNATGSRATLSVDANGSYSLDDPAHMAALVELDSFNLSMIEQPLAADDLVRHASLQQGFATRICLDESITGVESVESMMALGSGRVVSLKPGRVGGLNEAIRIHDICARAEMPLWCGGMLETGIGRAYNVALASLPGFTEPGDLSPSARYWGRDVVTPAWTMDNDGRVRVPLETPGIGVEVDTGFVDELTVRSVDLVAP